MFIKFRSLRARLSVCVCLQDLLSRVGLDRGRVPSAGAGWHLRAVASLLERVELLLHHQHHHHHYYYFSVPVTISSRQLPHSWTGSCFRSARTEESTRIESGA